MYIHGENEIVVLTEGMSFHLYEWVSDAEIPPILENVFYTKSKNAVVIVNGIPKFYKCIATVRAGTSNWLILWGHHLLNNYSLGGWKYL